MADYDPQPDPTNGDVNTAGLNYLIYVQANLPLAMRIYNRQTGLEYTTTPVAGVMTVVQIGAGSVIVPPTSPNLFVSNAGSDAITQPGTLAAPLLTVQEAVRRLAASGWLVEAFVTSMNTINFGANPVLAVPEPQGGALPICFQTTYTIDINLTYTGGTQGTSTGTGVAGATFTTGVAMGANAHQFKLLRVNTGATILGTRYAIESNTAGGIFTVPARLAAAPVGGSMDIISRTGKWTWSGDFMMDIPGGALLDGMEMLPTGANAFFSPNGSTLQESAVRYVTAAAGFQLRAHCKYESMPVFSSQITATTRQTWNPTGVTPCGQVYDGTAAAGAIGGTAIAPITQKALFNSTYMKGFDLNAGFGAFFTCGMAIYEDCGFQSFAGKLAMFSSRFQNCRAAAGGTAILSISQPGTVSTLSSANFVTPATGFDLIMSSAGGSVRSINAGGAAVGAGKFFLVITTGAMYIDLGGNTATGSVVGSDVQVDGGTAFPVGDLATMGVVGAQNGTFQHSTSSLGASPITVNKFMGFGAVAVAATVLVINNSLADVGDACHLTPTSINATVAKWSAVCTLNTITITTDAAPTVAIWTFNWELVKATV